MRSVAILLAAAMAVAQSPQLESIARQRAAVELMSASLERQKDTVRKQGGVAAPAEPGQFFTVSWPRAPSAATPFPEPPRAACTPLSSSGVWELAALGSSATGLPVRLISEVMRRESGFNPCAVSPAGAMGLMQLMPATASDLGVENPFDPLQNVLAGSRFLRQMLERYEGDLARALGAYNAGPARIDAFGGLPPFPETTRYVGDILARLRR